MNNLKFIDTEIECCYLTINKAKEENLYQKTLSILIPENKNINLAVLNDLKISLNEEKVKFFQQIKSELEAWYEVRKDFILEWNNPNDASGYYCKYFGDLEYNKIKKGMD